MSRSLINRFLVLIPLLSSTQTLAQTIGEMTDGRDGAAYQTVTYKLKVKKDSAVSLTWMAQNLNFNSPDSYCFANEAVNCNTKGRLYNWFEATQVCPVGWRLPSDEDWTRLVNLYGGVDKAGKHLKADKEAWPKGKGTNKSKFNGVPTGSSDSNGFYNEQAGFFWSATETIGDSAEASDWSFVPWLNAMRHWSGVKYIGNAVRCVKD